MPRVLITSALIQQCQHGVFTPLYYYAVDGKYSRRADLWVNKHTGKKVVEGIICSGTTDLSPVISRDENYNPECSCCYLGFAHTEEYHNKSIKK